MPSQLDTIRKSLRNWQTGISGDACKKAGKGGGTWQFAIPLTGSLSTT
jgi:hypothetical protein